MRRRRCFAAATLLSMWACGVPELTGGDPPANADEDATGGGGGGPSGEGARGEGGSPSEAAASRISLLEGAAVVYDGAFEWDPAELAGDSYTFVSDLGYGFRIDRFEIATYSVQLRQCEPDSATARLTWGFRAAHADHVATDDVSIVVVDRAENAMVPTRSRLGVGHAAAATYCQLFLLSRTLTNEGTDLLSNTVAVRGAYLKPGSQQWVSFDVDLPLSDGTLADLEVPTAPPLPVDQSFAELRLLVSRHPVWAFNGIRPEEMTRSELAWEILGGLLHTTSVRLEPAD